jgi:isopenicillin-N N-acyltransferase-like protein
MTQFPHVRVEGSALDRGRAYGSQARDRVQRSVAAYRDVFAHYAGWDWATVRRVPARLLGRDPRHRRGGWP